MKRAWKWVVEQLEEQGSLAKADLAMLIPFCEAWDLRERAFGELREEKVAQEDGANHRLAKHPAFQVWRDSVETLVKCARELGLTFSARSAPASTDDEVEALFTSGVRHAPPPR